MYMKIFAYVSTFTSTREDSKQTCGGITLMLLTLKY